MSERVAGVRIELRDIDPKVWRRTEMPVNVSLTTLHDIIQSEFYWDGSHLSIFKIESAFYTLPHFYDFGDYWEHIMILGKVRVTDKAVESYKNLSQVEQAFRTIKSGLEVRPIYVYSANHVRGQVFLCMLAYYVEWHMRRKLAPLLFQDDDRQSARRSPVAKAKSSQRAKQKADTKKTADGHTVSSFASLLEHLKGYSRLKMAVVSHPEHTFITYPNPTSLQERAFELLQINPRYRVIIR